MIADQATWGIGDLTNRAQATDLVSAERGLRKQRGLVAAVMPSMRKWQRQGEERPAETKMNGSAQMACPARPEMAQAQTAISRARRRFEDTAARPAICYCGI